MIPKYRLERAGDSALERAVANDWRGKPDFTPVPTVMRRTMAEAIRAGVIYGAGAALVMSAAAALGWMIG